MKFLIVMFDCKVPYNVFPYGLGYIAAIAEKHGHEVTVFDQAVTHKSDAELYNFIRNEGPFDLIGLGFQAAYFHTVKLTAKAIRDACGKTPFVLGGSAPTASPEFFLNEFNSDFILTGETEQSLPGFFEMIEGQLEPEKVNGLYWKEKNKVKSTPKGKPVKELDSIPFPAWDLFDMKSYTFPRRVAGINHLVNGFGMMTTRGCPYSCKFCYRMEPGFRLRSIENCMEEIKILTNQYGINYIKFDDELFMSRKKRTLEFCDAILKSGINLKWACAGRFNIADREQIRAMKKSGCVQIGFGLESGDQKILDEMDKKMKVEQIYEVANICKEEGLLINVPSMFGLPGDNKDSIRKTVDAVIASTTWHNRRTIRPMQPYPGSWYWNYCVENGLIKDEKDFFSRYFSSEKWVVNLTNLNNDEFDTVLFESNKRLLEEYYKHSLESDLKSFKQIYFDNDSEFFIPLR